MDPKALDTNRAWWNGAAEVHGNDAVYDTEALIAGADSLGDAENAGIEAAVGSIDGLDVIHVQCHIGFDTISLARRGARMVGLDFSPAALEKARELAVRAGVDVTWVEADSTQIPPSLYERFDLAYSTIGVLCWIDDVSAWMRSVAATLRPGGRLLLIDIHPLLNMIGEVSPLLLDFPYAYGGAHNFRERGTYAVPDAELPSIETVYYAHSLGEIVTAAMDGGLRIDGLSEHLDASKSPRPPQLPREDDGRYRLRVDGQPLPLLFTLIATREARTA